MDDDAKVAGVRPWIPGTLGTNRWIVGTLPAERFAALRIGTALVLLFDIFVCYWPDLSVLYGAGSWSEPNIFGSRFESGSVRWSILRFLPTTWGPQASIGVWALSGFALLIGYRPQLAACIAWAFGVSFWNSNYYAHNGGDRIRNFLLLVLMFIPSGTVWSVRPSRIGARLVWAWPMALLMIHLCVMYFFNGFSKLKTSMWLDGSLMPYVMNDVSWTHWSMSDWPIPFFAAQLLTWFVLIWEVTFPVLVYFSRTRLVALLLGVFFHIGTSLQLEIGPFGLYAMCLYLPLVPWEKYGRQRDLSQSLPIASQA